MDLLHTLSELTKDDRMVLSAFKSIFDSYNVRLVHSLVPVRLVGSTRTEPNQHEKNREEKTPSVGIARLSIIEERAPIRINEKEVH